MRSLSLKSLMVLMAGSRLLSRKGCELSAEMPRTSCGVPLVRDHSTSRPGTPPEPTSKLPGEADFLRLRRCHERPAQHRRRRKGARHRLAGHDRSSNLAAVLVLLGRPTLCGGLDLGNAAVPVEDLL